jgi:hypothetical protein
MLVGSKRQLGKKGRLEERTSIPLIKEAFIIVKYICTAYTMEYSLKSLHLLNYQFRF